MKYVLATEAAVGSGFTSSICSALKLAGDRLPILEGARLGVIPLEDRIDVVDAFLRSEGVPDGDGVPTPLELDLTIGLRGLGELMVRRSRAEN